MYIRSLSAEAARHVAIDQQLYRTFDAVINALLVVKSHLLASPSDQGLRQRIDRTIALLTKEKEELSSLLTAFLSIADAALWEQLLRAATTLEGRYHIEESAYRFTAARMPLGGSEQLLTTVKERQLQVPEATAWKDVENLLIETMASLTRLQNEEIALNAETPS